MENNTTDFIEELYSKQSFKNTFQKIRRSKPAKYRILDEEEFARGRQVLGDMIVHGMMTSGGTDLDWLIEHNGGFVIFEFKGFHNDKVSIPMGQMIAYERLHEKLNMASKCYLYIVGCDDIDFSNPDSKIWIFEMNQWKNGGIPKNTIDIFDEESGKNNKYVVFREYFEEINVESLRHIIDNHWKEFELSNK